MAGDWIKIEIALPNKPEVMAIAEELDISEMEVVGHLVCFWGWVDQNLSAECPVVSGTIRGLDRVAGRTGFAKAMINAGWLKVENGHIEIPNYEEHLSQTAKQRSVEAKRKKKQREKVSHNVQDKNRTESGTEKRREEKNKEEIPPNPPSGGNSRKQKKPPVTVDLLTFPQSLDCQKARESVAEWLDFKRSRGQAYKSPSHMNKLLEDFSRDGPDALKAAIDHSIANNYQGCFRPGGKHGTNRGNRSGPQLGPGQLYDPDSEQETRF